jgi:hypothetical protein
MSDITSPRRPLTWPLVRGLVTHAVLEQMIRIHRERGGPPARDPTLSRFWRANLPKPTSELVRDAINAELARSKDTASTVNNLLALAHREERSLVQFVNAKATFALSLLGGAASVGPGPLALGEGANTEVRLEAGLGPEASPWIGDADLIVVRGGEVVIADYKTGAEDPSHRDQLELYALLLARDHVRNPTGLVATELALLYWSGREERWPAPDTRALADLEERWCTDVARIRQALSLTPPTAYVGEEACARCEQRALCEDYWAEGLALTAERCDDRLGLVHYIGVAGAEFVAEQLAPLPTRKLRVVVPQRLRSIVVSLRGGERVRLTDIESSATPDADGDETIMLRSSSRLVVEGA